MASFQLSDGTKFTPSIDVTVIKLIRKDLDVDLCAIFESKVLADLRDDIVLFVDVLYLTCREQCENSNISDEEFGKGLTGDAIADATEAFLVELTNFTPPAKRPALTTVLQRIKEVEAKEIELGLIRVEDRMIFDLVEVNHHNATDKLKEMIQQAREKSGMSSPDAAAVSAVPETA